MSVLRRILGIFVMIAGVIGLVLALTGLVGLWIVRPRAAGAVNATLTTLTRSVDTSAEVVLVTNRALGATVRSVDELSAMLATTADSVADTQPVITQVNTLMGQELPATFRSATDSLETASAAAQSLESTIQSLDTFRLIMGTNPLMRSFLPPTDEVYAPDKPLAESLDELAVSLEDMPATFREMSVSIDSADDNLALIQANLEVMSESVTGISASLRQYQAMLDESYQSMNGLKSMLGYLQDNNATILNVTTVALGLFLLWFLAAQVVIFSQGYELFRGTAGRMEGGAPEPEPSPAPEPEPEPTAAAVTP